MQISPFVFQFKVDDDFYCLYHSITLKKIFLTENELSELNENIKGDKIDPKFQSLIDLKFIVNDDYDKYKMLNKIYNELGVKEPSPALSYIILTDSCNFRCKYCFIENALSHTGNNMDKETADKVINVIIRNSLDKPSYLISFYGGEPLLNFDIMKYIVERLEAVDKEKFKFSIVTNGSLIDDSKARFFKIHNFDVGLSLDGWPSLDNLRIYQNGDPTFYDALKGLSILRKYNVNVGISCTVNRYNYKHLDEIVEFFSHFNVGISFNLILDKNSEAYGVEDPIALEKSLFSAFKKALQLGILEDRIGRRRAEPFFKEIPVLYDCPAYGQQIFFSPKGKLGPCQAFYTTDLYQEDITDDFDAKRSKVMYPWIELGGPFNSPHCADCPAIGICGGACAYNVYTKTGKLDFIDPYFCTIMNETLKDLIQYYYEIEVKGKKEQSVSNMTH